MVDDGMSAATRQNQHVDRMDYEAGEDEIRVMEDDDQISNEFVTKDTKPETGKHLGETIDSHAESFGAD